MSPATIIREAEADGVTIALSTGGTIKAKGEPANVSRWLDVIREHKAELLQLLAASAPVEGQATPTQAVELRRFVRACGAVYAFTEDEHREALQIALADPENALTCFRAMAAKLGFQRKGRHEIA